MIPFTFSRYCSGITPAFPHETTIDSYLVRRLAFPPTTPRYILESFFSSPHFLFLTMWRCRFSTSNPDYHHLPDCGPWTFFLRSPQMCCWIISPILKRQTFLIFRRHLASNSESICFPFPSLSPFPPHNAKRNNNPLSFSSPFPVPWSAAGLCAYGVDQLT